MERKKKTQQYISISPLHSPFQFYCVVLCFSRLGISERQWSSTVKSSRPISNAVEKKEPPKLSESLIFLTFARLDSTPPLTLPSFPLTAIN